MAEAANQRGNAYYKEGNYAKARELFKEAMQLDENEPKYPSNLSAVQYETGKYSQAVDSIRLSWKLLQAKSTADGKTSILPATEPLAIKLATRFAKASSHDFYSQSDSLHNGRLASQNEIDHKIDQFVSLERTGKDVKVDDMKAAWTQWKEIRDGRAHNDFDECKKRRAAAQTRLRSLPIFKSASDPTLEYYTFGHDHVRTLLDGINRSPEFCLDSPENADQNDWSFLLGGSGDARHVFATMIHLANIGFTKPVDALNIHITLVDVHPTSLARVIVVVSLLNQILKARLDDDMDRLLELYATLFYLYNTILMPNYCHQIVIDTAKTLVDELPHQDHSLSQFLHINEFGLPAILEVLKYWSAPLPKTAKAFLRASLSAEAQYEQFKQTMVSGLNLGLEGLGGRKNAPRGDGCGSMYENQKAEQILYKKTRVLLPPKPLLPRHPVLAQLARSYHSASDASYAAVKKEVEETWNANPTLFDNHSTENPDLTDGAGYPPTSADPFDGLIPFGSFAKMFQIVEQTPEFCRGNTGFAVSTQFFELVVEAMHTLKNSLKLEVVVGDVIAGTPRLLAGEFGYRPKEFPNKYHRIWLSNVPDYTGGILNNAVHLMTCLERDGLLMSNCLLNTTNWSTIADYCYNYTLLRPQDVPRFLGCEVLYPQGSAWKDIVIKDMALPRPLEELASKKELHAWLVHVLVCTLCPGIPAYPPRKVEMPNNLGAFMHVLAYLTRVGFPAHWIGDFLQSLISDNLVASAVPHTGRLPIPMLENHKKNAARKLRLGPWQADLQAILATTRDAFQFALALPEDYPSARKIRTYKAAFGPVDLRQDPRSGFWGPLASPFSRAVGIVFYKPIQALTVDELVPLIEEVLDGEPSLSAIDFQILLGQEHVDLRVGEVVWKMSEAWYEKIRRERWIMVVYRTDLKTSVTGPIDAQDWFEVL